MADSTPRSPAGSPARNGALAHYALLYRDRGEHVAEVAAFVRDGLAAAEPVLVAVPADRVALVQAVVGGSGQAVEFADMTVLGRNPARIIPAVLGFTARHAPGRARLACEPVWAGRTAAEVTEAARHEALVNAAFAAVPVTVMCLYHTALDQAVLEGAGQTHPHVRHDGTLRASTAYRGTALAAAIAAQPLPAPPARAWARVFGGGDLPALREQVSLRATGEGLPASRAADLVIAVHEITANTVVHAAGTGTLRIWREHRTLVCEVTDQGRITDPLAGRRPAAPGDGGHGLRIANELCDLVELHSGPWGTTIRMHIHCR